MIRKPLEAHTRSEIDLRLRNLGWIIDQKSPDCNVFQEQAKTDDQNKKFKGGRPDYVLYESGSDRPLGIIEAKKPGQTLDKAIVQAEKYAKVIGAPIVFAFNDTFVISKHIEKDRPLKVDGAEVQDFIDRATIIRFINQGPEILSAPKGINFSREELLEVFKSTNKLLRKEGLRDGYERFSAFAEILFLKLIDESEKLNEHSGQSRTIDERFCWGSFTKKYKGQELFDFVSDSVWNRMRKEYGDIFSAPLGIKNPSTLEEIIKKLDPINFTSTDSDIKGDAFEYFLKSVTNGNKDLGEYFTPRHIARTVINLVKPVYGETIYDPFCGTGGFLLEAFKYLSLRADTHNPDILKTIKTKSLYGREITSTARIAKMNMILFGDGHTNIEQVDTLMNPIDEKYDIVVANIPYSQETEHGSYYSIPTKDADSICLQHIFRSLKPGGRAAVIVPETFLYKDSAVGQTRELIAKQSSKFNVISLPRGVFMPYTPTKTNILYFEKGGEFKDSHHFVIHNDGFELNTGRKPIEGSSDLKRLLSSYEDPTYVKNFSNIVPRNKILASGNWNLRPYYYMEDIPKAKSDLVYLDESVIKERKDKIDPRKILDKPFNLLQVSQNGIFLADTLNGSEATQSYKKVKAGDIVYNPYRVNIGSIGVVPKYLDGSLVSPAYVVIRVVNDNYPPTYLVSILKHPRYLRIIMNYSLSSARASLPFDELKRIKVPKLDKNKTKKLQSLSNNMQEKLQETNIIKDQIYNFTKDNVQFED